MIRNLFSCLALFEAYCLRLSGLVELRSGLSMEKVAARRGIQGVFKFFSDAGIKHFDLDYSLQMNAALQIRNCLIHAEGLLSWDKNESALRRIVDKRTFLSADDGIRLKMVGRKIDEVVISEGEFGDKIVISNTYAHRVVSYARWYLIAAATAAHKLYVEPSRGS